MLAFEPASHHQHPSHGFGIKSSSQDPYYPDVIMNTYGSFDSTSSFSYMPYSCYETQPLFVGALPESFKYDMYRTNSYNGQIKPSSQHSELPPSTLSTASGPSIPSASSSTVGSPYSGHAQPFSHQESWVSTNQGLGLGPAIVNHEEYGHDFVGSGLDPELTFTTNGKILEDFVDPSLIQPSRLSYAESSMPYSGPNMFPTIPHAYQSMSPGHSPSPVQRDHTAQNYQNAHVSPRFSPPMTYNTFQQPTSLDRRASISSLQSKHSQQSPRSASADFDEEGKEKGRCPNPECGRVFKDLKAHMLTHQSERPEKCPILNCEYNQKGFARKYDKNRHTLTHYKGTMVCGFCPGSGSAAEKSFNRADVFKRHLTSVHGVEQSPPNSRKRSPTSSNKKITSYCQDATGKCSTCSATFSNAQDFYEHLDDCVLRVVQQEEPSEAINQQRLAEVAADQDVKETMDRHMLTGVDESLPVAEEDYEEEEEDDEDDDPSYPNRSGKGMIKASKATASSRVVIGGGISKPTRSGRKGLTYSKGGVSLVCKSRKKRKHYPPAWGVPADKMKFKKRVLCVYDGERRLWKDDMMLDSEFEVRMKLANGGHCTDLDVESIKRANAIHGATAEEKGPWVQDEVEAFDLEEFMS